jgi:hypothetical protein
MHILKKKKKKKKKIIIESMRPTCRSYKFNSGFTYLLYGDDQKMGKRMKLNIFHK